MTNLTTAQIAGLTALILGNEPKRAASKDEAVKRFHKVAGDAGLLALSTQVLDLSFDEAKEAIIVAFRPTPEPTRGGAGLARLRKNTDAAALAEQSNREASEALARASAERVALSTEIADDEIPAFLKRDRLGPVADFTPPPPAAPVAKAKPARKEPKVREEAATTRTKVSDTAVITSVVENPKKPGSRAHACFAHYRAGQTVAEFIAACATAGIPEAEAKSNLSWDRRKSFIVIG